MHQEQHTKIAPVHIKENTFENFKLELMANFEMPCI